jgi:hypothetical protein
MEFECNTPVHWLRDARLQVEGQIVRVVLLAQVGTFPAGYVGMMDQPRANDAHDAVRITRAAVRARCMGACRFQRWRRFGK